MAACPSGLLMIAEDGGGVNDAEGARRPRTEWRESRAGEGQIKGSEGKPLTPLFQEIPLVKKQSLRSLLISFTLPHHYYIRCLRLLAQQHDYYLSRHE